MARKPLIAGNWKMNMNHIEAIALVQKISFALPDKYFDQLDVAVIPPFTDLRSVETLVDSEKLRLAYGAQDVSEFESGAYTGEISPSMLAKMGCTYVLVGHSERREYHNESDALVSRKAKAIIAHGMTAVVCVGEPLEIREQGTHVQVVCDQLRASLEGLTVEDLDHVVIAYEPIWAIGTGKTASSADAQEVCGAIRVAIAEIGGDLLAQKMRVLYGGSVSSSNVAELIAQPDVDGGLVGGASLKADEFAKLCAIAGQH